MLAKPNSGLGWASGSIACLPGSGLCWTRASHLTQKGKLVPTGRSYRVRGGRRHGGVYRLPRCKPDLPQANEGLCVCLCRYSRCNFSDESSALFSFDEMESPTSLDCLADMVSTAEETRNMEDPLMDCPLDVLMDDVAMEPGQTHAAQETVQHGGVPSLFSADEVLGMEFENPEEASRFYERYSRAKGFDMRQGKSSRISKAI
ncbi:hypothetical protein PIB30_047136 [Stylosanthes scabra]|uniref:Uncharacterized protein n=1 Tax=Stylosanthes scabra TaxID=79078 RepID=A0ABU6VIW2_9FABA|nr:hypothetical protein [Stylosanthes scabra]